MLSMATNCVEIENIKKTFGSQVAVDNLSLAVPTGSVYGFIGPNGSGKSTTLRMIMRIISPDQGTIRVLGETRNGAANDRVAYLPEERGLYKQMKIGEVLRFYSELKGHRTTTTEINDWLEKLDLSGVLNKKVEELSKGMSQKVQFIATVISKPELIILDEPFSGLDPGNAVVLRDAVLEQKRLGRTIIFSTHDMGVAERMCDFIFMIYKGKKVLDGTLESIQSTYGTDVVRVQIDGPPAKLNDLPGVMAVSDFGKAQDLKITPGTDTQQLLRDIAGRGRVKHFEIVRPNLNEIFMRIVSPLNPIGETVLA